MRQRLNFLPPAAALLAALVAVGGGMAAQAAAGASLQAVVSTTILQDLVQTVAGDGWSVVSLMPPGADPHSYQPAPGDARRLASARLVVLVGAGLEPPALSRLVRTAAPKGAVVELAPLVAMRRDEIARRAYGEGGPAHPDEGELDPHFWWSVPRVMQAVEAVADTLARLDPGGEPGYRARAAAYRRRLQELDAWIRQQVATIPPERRLLVANHDALGHLAAEYGFTVVGTVLPGGSTLAEASASDTARLLQRIRSLPVKAIFAEATASPALGERVSREAHLPLVTLYTDSLGPPGSGAETYEGFMRTNVTRIVEALRDG